MDTRNGRIYEKSVVDEMNEDDQQYMREFAHHPTPEQRASGKVYRNDSCPCGSGRKFKKCCLFKAT